MDVESIDIDAYFTYIYLQIGVSGFEDVSCISKPTLSQTKGAML